MGIVNVIAAFALTAACALPAWAATSTITSGVKLIDTVDVRTCGAVPDGKKVVNIVTTSGSATATSASGPFTSADAGKAIKIYKSSNGTYPFRGTISTYNSATSITLSSTASVTCASGDCYAMWGTNNASAINTCLDNAAALVNTTVNDPNMPKGGGRIRVTFPIDSRGDAYLFSSTLTPDCCNLEIDADAALYSNTGSGASDRAWAIDAASSTHIRKAVIVTGGGMGVDIGDNASTNSSSFINDLQVWNVGENYDAGASPNSQIALRLTGYDFSINRFWSKGGNIGVHFNQASDVFANHMEVIGASTGVQFTSVENCTIPNMVCDTGSFVCLAIDGSRNCDINARAMSVTSTTLTTGVQMGAYDSSNLNRGIRLYYSAQRTGGVGASVANTEDSTLMFNFTNSALFSASGGSMTSGITYGTGNAGSLNITMNRDGAIGTIFTGTRAGRLIDISDSGMTLYGNGINYSGTAPTVTSGSSNCGTSPSVAGNDNAGIITVGSSTNGGKCPLNFATTWTNTPVCVGQNGTTGNLLRPASASTSSVQFTGTLVAGDKLYYHCFGYK